MSHLVGWGDNHDAQLGNGTASKIIANPTDSILFGEDNKEVSVGGSYMLALKANGTVLGVGNNVNSQLGNGNKENYINPILTLVSGIKKIVSSGGHTFALTYSGRVLAWGSNSYSAIGNGVEGQGESDKSRDVPIPVDIGLENVVDIATGAAGGLAIHADGTVSAWGENAKGENGVGNQLPILTPTKIPSLTDIISAAQGGGASLASHSLFLHANGTVSGCGAGRYGCLINPGPVAPIVTPVLITGLFNIVKLGGGTNCSFALNVYGELLAWGQNVQCQLGIAGLPEKTVHAIPTVIATDVSDFSFNGNSGALIKKGQVYTWGGSQHGEGGLGTIGVNTPVPTQIESLGDVESVSVGATQMVAMLRGRLSMPKVTIEEAPSSITVSWGKKLPGKIRLAITSKGSEEKASHFITENAESYQFSNLPSKTTFLITIQESEWGRATIEASTI